MGLQKETKNKVEHSLKRRKDVLVCVAVRVFCIEMTGNDSKPNRSRLISRDIASMSLVAVVTAVRQRLLHDILSLFSSLLFFSPLLSPPFLSSLSSSLLVAVEGHSCTCTWFCVNLIEILS